MYLVRALIATCRGGLRRHWSATRSDLGCLVARQDKASPARFRREF